VAETRPTFDSAQRDRWYWQELGKIAQRCGYDQEAILRNWQAYIMRRDLPRFLAHYEIFKNVVDLPGCILELGVYRGASFFTWANLAETFFPFDRTRKVYGFDHFKGLGDFSDKDGVSDSSNFKVEGGWRATLEEVSALVEMHNADNMIPNTTRCALINGDVRETIPEFLKKTPGVRISLLHLDMDLYEPTKFALEHLYPLVVTGGAVVFDEYGLVPWQGESNAADEYFSKLPSKPRIHKFPFSHLPHGYFIKE
jgi:hypothetical protein